MACACHKTHRRKRGLCTPKMNKNAKAQTWLAHAKRRIRLAKWLDEYFGRVLVWMLAQSKGLWQPARCDGQAAVRRILLIKFWGLGSLVLLEPAQRRLRREYPSAGLHLLTLAQNRELVAMLPQIDRLLTVDFRQPWRFLFALLRLLRRLRHERYDLIVDAEFFANTSAILGRLAAPQRLAGFSRPGSRRGELLDIRIDFSERHHAASNFERLALAAAGTRVSNNATPQPRLHLPQAPVPAAIAALPAGYVVLNVHASPLALERRWPAAYFVVLGNWLLRRYQTTLVLIGTAHERAYTAAIARRLGSGAINVAGMLTLAGTARLLQGAALLISNDSGPVHLASALDVPVAAFYGPETPALFGPLAKRRLVFYLSLPCSPCMSVDNAKTVHCTNARRCTRDLTPALVLPRLQAFVRRHKLLQSRRQPRIATHDET